MPRFRGRYPLQRRYLPRFYRIIVEGVSIILQFPKFPIPLHFLNRRYTLHVPLSVLAQAPASCEARAHRQPESTPARMAESVDALVSNTSGAIRAGSIPAPGTIKSCKHSKPIAYRIIFFQKLKNGHFWSPLCNGDLKTPQNLLFLFFVKDSYVVSFSRFA